MATSTEIIDTFLLFFGMFWFYICNVARSRSPYLDLMIYDWIMYTNSLFFTLLIIIPVDRGKKYVLWYNLDERLVWITMTDSTLNVEAHKVPMDI